MDNIIYKKYKNKIISQSMLKLILEDITIKN